MRFFKTFRKITDVNEQYKRMMDISDISEIEQSIGDSEKSDNTHETGEEFKEDHKENEGIIENPVEEDLASVIEGNVVVGTTAGSEKMKNIKIDIVIDATYSFTKIFLPVYKKIENLLKEIRSCKSDYPNINIMYGITLIRESKPEQIKFGSEENAFTDKEDEVLKAMQEIRFRGGNHDGKEQIEEAIELGLRTLAENTKVEDDRGILVFTDSLPNTDNDCFDQVEGCNNKGVRFAISYVYDKKQFSPQFDVVDGEQNGAQEGRNTYSKTYNISDLFKIQDEEMNMMKEIFDKLSVRG